MRAFLAIAITTLVATAQLAAQNGPVTPAGPFTPAVQPPSVTGGDPIPPVWPFPHRTLLENICVMP